MGHLWERRLPWGLRGPTKPSTSRPPNSEGVKEVDRDNPDLYWLQIHSRRRALRRTLRLILESCSSVGIGLAHPATFLPCAFTRISAATQLHLLERHFDILTRVRERDRTLLGGQWEVVDTTLNKSAAHAFI